MAKADDWKKKFWKPIKPKDGKPLETLADARAYMIALPGGITHRNEWQYAAAALIDAAKGGSAHKARDAMTNALFLSMRLDLDQE